MFMLSFVSQPVRDGSRLASNVRHHVRSHFENAGGPLQCADVGYDLLNLLAFDALDRRYVSKAPMVRANAIFSAGTNDMSP